MWSITETDISYIYTTEFIIGIYQILTIVFEIHNWIILDKQLIAVPIQNHVLFLDSLSCLCKGILNFFFIVNLPFFHYLSLSLNKNTHNFRKKNAMIGYSLMKFQLFCSSIPFEVKNWSQDLWWAKTINKQRKLHWKIFYHYSFLCNAKLLS